MSYKNNKVNLGCSDIARLTMISPEGVQSLNFGKDSTYSAWLNTNLTHIPSHYRQVYKCSHWLKIYDDKGLAFETQAPTIEVYRAGEHGCLINKVQKLHNFYFTFGTSESMPYQGGWIIIKAENIQDARRKFINEYGCEKIGNTKILNCSFWYTEEEFKDSCMYKENDNLGAGCHRIIE